MCSDDKTRASNLLTFLRQNRIFLNMEVCTHPLIREDNPGINMSLKRTKIYNLSKKRAINNL